MRVFLLALWFAPGIALVADGLIERSPVVLHVGAGSLATSLWLAVVLFAVVEGAKR